MAERGRVALFGYELKQLLRDTDAPMLAACAADGDHEICFALVQIVGQQEGKQILGFVTKSSVCWYLNTKLLTGSSSPVWCFSSGI